MTGSGQASGKRLHDHRHRNSCRSCCTRQLAVRAVRQGAEPLLCHTLLLRPENEEGRKSWRARISLRARPLFSITTRDCH